MMLDDCQDFEGLRTRVFGAKIGGWCCAKSMNVLRVSLKGTLRIGTWKSAGVLNCLCYVSIPKLALAAIQGTLRVSLLNVRTLWQFMPSLKIVFPCKIWYTH